MPVVETVPGLSPLILAFPHTGTDLPDDIRARLNTNGLVLADTDWHVHELYAGLLPGATTVRATFHRYVIDANRDPAGGSLYPGRNTTGLVPATDFDGRPIWRDGAAPGDAETAERRDLFHRPYHLALTAEVERVRALHGIAVLWDCHSIRSRIPFLFEGELPALNVGTDGGRTADPRLLEAVMDVAARSGYSRVLDGRFRGGWTTRHYGRPEAGVHAIQMELAQSTHLAAEAPPFAYDPDKAARLRRVLGEMLASVERIALRAPTPGG